MQKIQKEKGKTPNKKIKRSKNSARHQGILRGQSYMYLIIPICNANMQSTSKEERGEVIKELNK